METTFWKKSYRFATNQLNLFEDVEINSIGGLYTVVMLYLIQLESCVKILNSTQSIFKNKNQMDHRQWYTSQHISKGKLFAVTNLETALAALLEISSEGEGGLACSAFISAIPNALDNSLTTKSHYAKFQEMSHERELAVLNESPPPWTTISCLDQNNKNCPCILRNGTASYVSDEGCLLFCFTGKSLAVNQQLDVWPIKSMESVLNQSLIPSETIKCSNHFDKTYTTLLNCLGEFD